MIKISVIMPSFLGEYDGAATDRPFKLRRAIESFLAQDYENKELIIVADGCDKTTAVVIDILEDDTKMPVYLRVLEKQEKFSGAVRDLGLKQATGNIICYLDNDDLFKDPNHLTKIVEGFVNTAADWVYFNDYVKYFGIDTLPIAQRQAHVRQGQIGISNIAHKNHSNITWQGCNGYGHDYTFIKTLELNYPNFKKITGPSYLVCHIPGSVDN